MAVTFFPFNSIVVDGVPDRPANAENLAAYLAGFFSNGVIMQEDTALKVEAHSGMEVQIQAGMGNIRGKTILNDAAEIITLDTASASLDRIDRVVFRLDEIHRLMEFDVLTGTPASSPVAPALTQTADVYELCLAEIRVPAGASEVLTNYITDTRLNETLCGVTAIPPHVQDLKHGGTGLSVETIEELLLALGGANVKLLWQNASPTSSFAAQSYPKSDPDINLFADYDMFVAICKATAGATTYHKSQIALKNKQALFQWTANDNNTTAIMHCRRLITVSDSSITFTDCTSKQGSTISDPNNSYLIPFAVYGIKGVQ